jgi:hypothetical protein
MEARKILRGALLSFVWVSVGFGLGKELALRSVRAPQTPPQAAGPQTQQGQQGVTEPPAKPEDKLIVYYLHATIRCATCNRIERMTHEALQAAFAKEMEEGRIVWRTASFQKEEDLARKYDVASSSVVLVRLRGGQELGFRRLDKVWELVYDAAGFSNYVIGGVRELLGRG